MGETQTPYERAVQAALAFAAERPWETLADSDLFGVKHPDSEETGYISVMGKRGEFRALGLYPGGEGLKSYHLLAKEEEEEGDRLYAQNCLMVMFKKREESSQPLLEQFLALGLEVPHDESYPEFWSFRPGLVPMPADEEELDFLRYGLEQGLEMFREKKVNPEVLKAAEDKKGQYLVRMKEEGAWRADWEKPDNRFQFNPDRLSMPQEASEKLKNGLAKREAFVLIDLFFIDQAQADENNPGARHFFPKVLIVMNLESQEVYHIGLLHPHRLVKEMPIALVEIFGEMGFRPENVVVCEQEIFVLLRDLLKSLGMQCFLEPGANVRAELKQELNL